MTQTEPQTEPAPRQRRWGLWAAAGAVLLLAAGLALAWVYLPRIAEAVVLRFVSQAGIADAGLEIESIGLYEAELAGVRIGGADGAEPDLEVASASLTYTPADLYAGRIGTAHLEGVRLRGRYDDEGLHLGALDTFLEGDGGSEGGGIPLDAISLTDGQAVIETADGPVTVSLDGDLGLSGGQIETSDVSFAADGAGVTAEGQARMSVDGEETQFALSLATARIEREEVGGLLMLDGVAIEGTRAGDAVEASLKGDTAFEPAADAEIPFARSAATLDLDVTADLAAQRGEAVLNACMPLELEGLTLGDRPVKVSGVEICPDTEKPFAVTGLQDEVFDYRLDFTMPGFDLDIAQAGGGRFIAGTAPEAVWHVTAGAGIMPVVDVQLSGGALSLPGAGEVALSDFQGRATLRTDGDAPALKLDVERAALRDLASPTRFSPMSVSANAALDTLTGDGTLTGDVLLRTPGGTRLATGDFSYSLATARGRVRFDTPKVTFAPDKLQPQTLVPALSGVVADVSGSMNASGTLSFNVSGITASSAVLTMDGLGLQAPAARFSGIAGTVKFSSLMPIRTNGAQTVRIGLLDPGLPLENGEAAIDIDAGAVVIEKAVWPFAGGELRVTSGKLLTDAETQKAELTASDVDLAKLLEIIDLKGLSGEGLLRGTVPVEISGGTVYVRNAVLEAQPGGQISYVSDTSDAAAGAAEGASIAFRALENFRFKVLRVEIDGPATGNLSLRVLLEGANPEVYDGYPIKLNVTTEGAFLDLIRRGTVGFRAMDIVTGRDAAEGVSVERVDGEEGSP